MARTLAELRALTDETLVAEHDEEAPKTVVGTGYYLDELARRDQSRQTKAMLRYTQIITVLTAVVTIATLINVWIAADPTILFR